MPVNPFGAGPAVMLPAAGDDCGEEESFTPDCCTRPQPVFSLPTPPVFSEDLIVDAYRTDPGARELLAFGPESAGHLALDEALLQAAESGVAGECLRIWESAETFVVLGAGGRWSEEVVHHEARHLGIPVLRRSSGGGTVLQGPGCVNFVAVLDCRKRPDLQTVAGTNEIVLGSVLEALSLQGYSLEIRGSSDLAHGKRKVSGNAQRRRKHFVLFHGTLLTNRFDLSLISQVLAHPVRQPDWREQRAHGDFVDCLNVDTDRFWKHWTELWGARPSDSVPQSILRLAQELVRDKFSQSEWNRSL
jgi:lipoate-protein ligase A